MVGLLRLLGEHGEAIEADLLQHFGVDLGELGSPDLSFRRLRVLIAALPRTSRFGRAVGGEQARWGDTEHLLATVCDLLIQLNHNLVQANSRKRLRPPRLMKRPGVERDDPGTRRYQGKPMPLSKLDRLRQRWKRGG